ncbi:uncharacterized protein LOC130742561 [Lotus japonicus]|uniref:uncharacterized protein LOC130742561 n=1 Tax=Lotus japonicus TaxID=34305 RepID=UPI0025910FED|nr:uncharacterized protein LOC130742561 [Lotus japonicus]
MTMDNCLLHMKEEVNADNMAQVAMICWSIWKARNDKIFNKIAPDSSKTVELAINMRTDWLSHQPPSTRTSSVPSDPSWTLPPTGFMKLNFDAGWSGEMGSGFGMVIRDDEGRFQIAATHYEDCILEPLIAEACCLRWALNLAVNWELDGLVVASDCQQLVKAFHCPADFPSLRHILLDCHQMVNS